MLALVRYEAGVCECGFHESLTSDLGNSFQPNVRKCNVCAGTALYARVLHEGDEVVMKAMGESPAPGRPRPTDGRRMFVQLLPPDHDR